MTNRIKVHSPVLFAIIIVATIVGLVMANVYYIRHHPIEKKFLTPWLGMRTFLEIGSNPYEETAAQRTQLLYYGNLAEYGQDPLLLSQPFVSELLYFPIALITDYTTARVIWMVFLELLLFGAAFLCISIFKWKLPAIIATTFAIFIVLGPQSVKPLLENDQVIVILFFLLLGLLGLERGFDELSGAAFALAFFQPSVTMILCIMTFWWAFHNRRKRIIWGAMMAWGFLFIASLGLFPGWFLSFIQSFRSEFIFLNYQSTYEIFSNLWPSIGTKVAVALTILMIIILILEWRAASNKDFRWYLWVASFTLASYPLVGIPTLSANNIVLLIPMTYILKVVAERIGEKPRWMFIGVIIWLIFFGSWALTLASQDFAGMEAFELLIFFSPSLLLIAGLYWIRWWATRPSLTWVDLIDREQR